MAVRHLLCIMKDSEYKVAKYGGYDGEPDFIGVDILDFLIRKIKKDIFITKLNKVSKLSQEEAFGNWVKFGIKSPAHATAEDNERFYKVYPEMNDKCIHNILKQIQISDGELKIEHDINFAGDSYVFEWVYVIDFDKNTFEVYEGFNKEKLNDCERFVFLNSEIYHNMDIPNKKFYPVKYLIEYDLDNLPTKEIFLSDINKIVEKKKSKAI